MSAEAIIDQGLRRSLILLSAGEQKKVLKTIRWFEHELAPHKRQDRSTLVENAPRRRLRFVSSGRLRVIYCQPERNVRHWIWAGHDEDLVAAGIRLDDAETEDTKPMDLETMIELLHEDPVDTGHRSGLNGSANEAVEVEAEPTPELPIDEVGRLVEAATSVSMYTQEAKAVWERLKSRLETQAREAPLALVLPEARVMPVDIGTVIADYNAMRAERDRLKEALKVKKKREGLDDLDAAKALSRMSSEETRIAEEQVRRLTTELAAIRAANKRELAAAFSAEAKQTVKDACAKVCEDQAAWLARTGRASLEEQAGELHKLAVKIRALRV
jgi:hypothetical protein